MFLNLFLEFKTKYIYYKLLFDLIRIAIRRISSLNCMVLADHAEVSTASQVDERWIARRGGGLLHLQTFYSISIHLLGRVMLTRKRERSAPQTAKETPRAKRENVLPREREMAAV